ncbi:hypothetical protein ACH4E7_23995 [Kitasatospora sp. NPDC018058]|uniref:hypothetical protein n=1 Tax=Kitasatospora sp. NPDC018058 TaxID=3364025 RepID=UPI0037BF419F
MTNNVKTGEDFRALLRSLIGRFEDPGTDVPELDDILLRWADSLPDRAPEPGWPGLADQLLGALNAPSAGPAEPAPLGGRRPVASSGELRALLRGLAADYARDRAWRVDRQARGQWAGDGGGWASASLTGFLESWEAWLGARLGRAQVFSGVQPIEPVTWASVAMQLGAARVYE